ncbi:nucleoid-associated protein [Halomonas getboli]|uniref:nucleoid-associated protein n=1 Tax=Halomonas getboli TaxID=2935862 RepID=UPI0020001A98|nr:nucleoid-associated protein [Halomonas getboli]MCK2183636.1 nucleoid-associated protein [Halomonas getboli]
MSLNTVEAEGQDVSDSDEDYLAKTDLHHLITHELRKDKHVSENVTVKPRSKPLAKTKLAQKLVDQLYEIYSSKPSKSFGYFNGKVEENRSQVYVKRYFVDRELDFKTFSVKMAHALAAEARRSSASTGGHVFVAQFSHAKKDYLLVAIINDEYAIALNEEEDRGDELEEVGFLNLKGLRFAGQINVTAWRNEEDRYLSFLKGTGDVADYFKRFLACDSSISNLNDTQSLTSVVEKFASTVKVDGEPLSDQQRDDFFKKVDEYCRAMADESLELHLEEFSNVVWPREPEALKTALAESETPISDGFVPNKRGLFGLVKFRGKSQHWILSFDREAIAAGNIQLLEDNSIKLSDVPPHLIESLRRETSRS